ncbi:hypothetical protein KR026_006989 [Drosophila bipectinata]|nr:hypothetical protein KR026_006989 [Drosophila bipectinata]
MLQHSLALLLFLGIFAALQAAPSSSPETKREQLVRVYEINEEQYERVLQLTKGKNLISEARLINGGFATVSETLSSGWHSLLRIVGLTTISKADEAEKIDFDGQPLCVIKTREGEPMGRDEEVADARSLDRAIESEDDESAIHCIVVLKKDEQELPSQSPNPSFAAYWNPPQTTEESPVVKQTQESEAEKEDPEKEEPETTSVAPLKKKKGNKSIYPSDESTEDARQIPGAYPLPQYGTPYPGSYGTYPYGPSPYPGSSPYGPQPYVPPYGQSPYSPYGPYGPQLPYGPQQPYGPPPPPPPQQPPYVSPYYPQQVYGPQPYPGAYPYLDKEGQKAEEKEDEDQDEEDSEEEDDYRNRYYYKKTYVQQPYYYQQQ